MKETDRKLIERLGGTREVATALELDGQPIAKRLETVKKWSQNGIPWKWRAQVLKLARTKGKRVPADFLVERRAA